MFRRRRAAGVDKPPAEGPHAQPPADDARSTTSGLAASSHDRAQRLPRGPWDVADPYPERDRIDLGSLRVPSAPGFDIQVNFSGEHAVAVLVVRGENMLQLQAFAAPKRTGLWDDIRHELIEELTAAGSRPEEAEGPFGPEIRARVPADVAAGGARGAQSPRSMRPARFLGADGPRWFLHGIISGPAAAHPKHSKMFEDVFSDTVVSRGDHPMPPRDLLELRLPAEAQRALEEHMAQAGAEQLDPFARGPEITEIR